METIPKNILDKLLNARNPLENFCLFQTDYQGMIIDFLGQTSFYIDVTPEKGKSITTYLDFTQGLFPLPEKEIRLSNLQLADNCYTDVLVMESENKTLWFFLFDVTPRVKQYESAITRLNELKYQKEQQHTVQSNALGHLELFDMATFKRQADNSYEITGRLPQWVTTLKPEMVTHMPHLYDVFPYLEIFEQEAGSFWREQHQGVLPSGQWIENDVQGEEYLLKALAVNFQDQAYLVIRLLDTELTGGQEVYQKARDLDLAYEKLAKTEARLKELLEYKEKFVSIISHDLRSPIASVLGIAEMLTNDEELKGKLDDFYREMLMGIKSEMTRLLDYNDKLYHWSNLELGNFNLHLEEIEVQKLANAVERTATHALEAKDLLYKKDIPEGLKIKADITLLLQALNNLIANAIKFTPGGGEVGFIARKDEADNILITIYDKGVGMPEKVRENLFRVQTTRHGTRGEKGSGLGLGIIKKVIDTHGFTITVNSEEGKGSQFTITIPAT